MNSNPDVETLKLLITIAFSIIAILLSVVAYFLNRQIKSQEILTDAVNQLRTIVSVLQSQNDDRHPVIDRRLNDHSKRLDEHDKQLARIETKLESKSIHL